MKTKWQSPGYGAKRAFQHERKKQTWVFSSGKNAEEPMTLWLERRDRIRAGSKETERESISISFPRDCKAQVKKLPLFCKSIAPALCTALRICQPVAAIPADAIHTGIKPASAKQGGLALRGASPVGSD
jgi:hypothetical protein